MVAGVSRNADPLMPGREKAEVLLVTEATKECAQKRKNEQFVISRSLSQFFSLNVSCHLRDFVRTLSSLSNVYKGASLGLNFSHVAS